MPKPTNLSIADVPSRFRSAIVTAACARSKADRPPTDRQVRQLRFIWMRGNLEVRDLPSLNWVDFGGLVCRGLLSVPEDPAAKLIVTAKGERWVKGS